MDGFVQVESGRFCGPQPTSDLATKIFGLRAGVDFGSVILETASAKNCTPSGRHAVQRHPCELPPDRAARMVAMGSRRHDHSPANGRPRLFSSS